MKNIKYLYNKLKKYKIKDVKKLNIKKRYVKKINLIETLFISDIIREYIDKNNKYCIKIIYKYKNKKIKLKYYSKELNVNEILLKKIINRTIFMMDITNIFKDINIIIYDTPFKKKLPCKNFCKELSSDNINSGLSYSNNIIIFRYEELLKVLIHELIHVLDIDVKYEDNINKKLLLSKLCIKDLLINESYVETWANIINIYLVLYDKKNLTLDNYIENLIKEKRFNLKQCCKIMIYYNINDINILCNNNIKDNTNIFSYFILKTYNLIYINNFLEKYMDKKNIIKSKYNYNDYVKYLYNIINKKNNILKKNIEKIKKEKYNLYMKMSITK